MFGHGQSVLWADSSNTNHGLPIRQHYNTLPSHAMEVQNPKGTSEKNSRESKGGLA